MALLEIAVLIGPLTAGCFGWLFGYHLLADQAPALGQGGR